MKRSRISITSFLTREAWCESTALATGMVALTAALGQLIVTDASANPEGGSVVAGEAEIDTSVQDEVTIDQSSSRAVIEWDSFSIDEGEHTRFVQPDADAVTLNRVTGSRLSEIAGKLSANGKIILVNPNGIMFTGTAEVDVGSLIASTSDVDNSDIMDGTNSVFVFDDGPLSGSIINDGDVTVAEGGLAAFVAPYVRNNGKITARLGRVALGSGNIFTLDLNGDGLTQLALADDVINVSREARQGAVDVTDDGLIEADGGLVVLSVSDASALIDQTINMDGVIRARSVESRSGKIILGTPKARTVVRGDLDVAGLNSETTGGDIELMGRTIVLASTSNIDASGPLGGGTILIGQASDPSSETEATNVVEIGDGVSLRADAETDGDGGKIEIRAKERLSFHGNGSARGGAESGNGGTIALVSADELDVTNAEFEASAPSGGAGQLNLFAGNITVVDVDALVLEESTNLDASESNSESSFNETGDIEAQVFLSRANQSARIDTNLSNTTSVQQHRAITQLAELAAAANIDLSDFVDGDSIDFEQLSRAASVLEQFADVDIDLSLIEDEVALASALETLSVLSSRRILHTDTIERTLDRGTNVAIFASDGDGGDILIGSDIDFRGELGVSLGLFAEGEVVINGDITSSQAPLDVEVESGGDITFASIASSLSDAVHSAISILNGDAFANQYAHLVPLPELPDGAIKTAGAATLTAGAADPEVEAPGAVRLADVTASTVVITANSGIEGRTATANLTLTNRDSGDIDIDNVGDATLRLQDTFRTSIDIDNTGELTLAGFEAENSSVKILATGNIDALTTIGTDDAPVQDLHAISRSGLELIGAVSSNRQILVGESVTLTGSFRTNGGGFTVGDSDTPRAAVIDSSSGPVVIDTRFVAGDSDTDDTSVSSSSGSITFNGTLDGTNTNDDDLTLRVGDGDVRFNGDVGRNVPLGVVRVEGNANATAVDVANVTTNEDVPVALAIGTPETSFQSFTISNLPVGSRLQDGNGADETIETADQAIDLTRFDLDTLSFTPPENSDDNPRVSVTLAIPTSDRIVRSESNEFNVAQLINGSTAESNFTVTVNPIVDGTDVQTTRSDWSGNRLPVQIDATLLDTDGSESAIIRIDDLPEGTTLSAGTPNPDGSFSLTLAELTNLELISANDGDFASALTVSTTTTEANDPAQPLVSASITLAIPERPVPLSPPIGPLPTVSLADTRILEGAGQHGPIGDAVRPNRLPDASPIVLASNREDAPQDLEEPIDPFSVEPAAGEDSARPEVWEACPDIVDASVSWQNTASDAAFNVNPNIVPYSVDVYCGGYQMTAAGRGVSEDYQDLSFVSRDFWTDLKQERTPSVIEELRSTPSTYSVR